MPTINNRGNFGIVYYGVNGGTLPTYTDVLGIQRTAIDLSGGGWLKMPTSYESAYFHAGLARRFTFEVTIVLGMGTIDFEALTKLNTDPAAAYAACATFRNDTQTVLAQHAFAASGVYSLQTANVGAVLQACTQARYTGSVDPASIIVRLQAET